MMHQIDRHIKVIEFPGRPYANCNCLLLEDDIPCLIDTGFDESHLENLQKSSVQLVVNSHGHADHCHFNHMFPQARILMHPANFEIIASAENYLKDLAFDTMVEQEWTSLFMQAVCYRPTRVDGEIQDGQEISTGRCHFQVLHMPGHCAGHCCFLFPEQGFVFTSDIEFAEFGPWYGAVSSSVSDQLRSIDRLAAIGADYYVSGHHQPVVRDHHGRKLKAYRDTILQRQRRVAEWLYGGRGTVEEIAKEFPIYRRLPNPSQTFWPHEYMMVYKHLLYLEEQGYAGHDGPTWFPAKTGISPAHLSL